MMKYALVTGATSGIGAEYAHQLAEAGHNIIVVSNRDGENGIMAERLRRECGVQAEPLYADLAQADAAEKIYAWCRAATGDMPQRCQRHNRISGGSRHTPLRPHAATPAAASAAGAYDVCTRGRAPRPEGNDALAQELHAGPRCQDRDAAVPSAPRTRRDASDAAAGRTTHAGEVTCKVRNTAADTKSRAAEREKRQ